MTGRWIPGADGNLSKEEKPMDDKSLCTCPEFTVPLTVPPDLLVARARRAVLEAGGTFEGDSRRGSFSVPVPLGKIDGSYGIEGGRVAIKIDRRPFLLDCWLIERFLREWMQRIPWLAVEEPADAGPACEFRFQFKGSAEDLVKQAKAAIEEAGGTLTGDANGGSFTVIGIKGSYRISGQTLFVTIHEKPWYLACFVIEAFIKSKIPS
jgi:hypothetical protein